MSADPAKFPNASNRGRWPHVLGETTAWVWTVLAGGGGFLLLLEKGPWPLTNGWFAMLSGIGACPLTTWILKRCANIAVSGWVRFGVAAFFFIAGQIALRVL